DRVLRVGENAGCALDAFLDGGRTSLDQTARTIVSVVVIEPGLAQHARALRIDDVVVLDRDVDVVTHAAAERACRIFDDRGASRGGFGRRSGSAHWGNSVRLKPGTTPSPS